MIQTSANVKENTTDRFAQAVKDREKAFEIVEKEIMEYAKSVKMILKERGLFIKVIIMSILFNALIMSIPFFVLTAFGGNMDFLECFTLSIAVTSAVYFIPTPGNAGAAEGTFFLVFSLPFCSEYRLAGYR